MALPAFRAAGAKSAGTTGATTVAAPTGIATGDLEILIAEVRNADTCSISNDGGGAWSAVTGTPIGVAAGEKLYVWYRTRAGGDGDPQVTPSADHVCAARLAYQAGTFDTSDPLEVETTGSETTSDTSYSFAPGVSTAGDDRLVLSISTILRDSNTASVPVCTNASLTALASRANYCTNSGAGGGFGVTEGAKAPAGSVGTFACTYGASSAKSYIAFAIKPVAANDFTQPVDDTIAGTDARALRTTKPVADAVTGTDGQVMAAGKGLADSLAGTDAVGNAVAHPLADAATVTDSVTATRGLSLQIDDSISGTDGAGSSVAKAVGDAADLSDSQALTWAATLVVEDAITATDAQTKGVARALEDAIAAADAASRDFAKALIDSGGLADLADPQLGASGTDHVLDLDDFIVGADGLGKAAAVRIDDAGALGDGLARQWTAIRTLTEQAAVTDEVLADATAADGSSPWFESAVRLDGLGMDSAIRFTSRSFS